MPLSAEHLRLIEEEEITLSLVLRVLLESSRRDLYDNFAAEMRDIHAALPTAGKEEYPHLLSRFDLLKRQVGAAEKTELPDRGTPYFARMVLEEEGIRHDVLLGHRAWMNIDHKLVIIDWKKTPLAGVFYTCREGDRYTVPLPDDRTRSGILRERRLLTIADGQLQAIRSGPVNLHRDRQGTWTILTPDASGPHASLRSGLPDWKPWPRLPGASISAFLDREQYRLLQTGRERTLLIRGGAGSGKTTVLIHRLAAALAADNAPDEHLLLVPEEGIAGSAEDLLKLLGARGARVRTFAAWTAALCRRLTRGLPETVRHDAPWSVARFKRHPALLPLLQRLARRRRDEFLERLLALKQIGPELHSALTTQPPATLKEALGRARTAWRRHLERHPELATLRDKLERFFTTEENALYDLNADRRELFLSRELLEEAVAAAGGELAADTVGELLARTALQFALSTEEQFRELYPQGLAQFRTLDGAGIDAGTPAELAGTMDREDAAVLLLLLEAKGGLPTDARFRRCRHLYLDEAQEFSRLELALIRRTMTRETRLSVSGDFTQLMRPVEAGQDWDTLLAALDRSTAARGTLRINYRSSRQVAAFSLAVLGPLAGEDVPQPRRDGEPVLYSRFADAAARGRVLREGLVALRRTSPGATVVVITTEPRQAEALYQEIAGIPGTELVLHGSWSRETGILVTTVDRVKGLEFDLVVLPCADPESFPATTLARRQLHVAASRAMQQLWTGTLGDFSPLLDPLLPHEC